MDDNKKQKQFYEKFWEDYKYQEQYAFYVAVQDRLPAIKNVWSGLEKPDKVLDFGCGNGVLTYLLKCNGFGKNILGVDISRKGIQNAQNFFSKSGLSFKPLDEFWLKNKERFNVILSSHVFEHINNPDETLKKIQNLSDWFIIEVPLENAFWPNLISTIRRKPRVNNPLGHVNFWSKNSFQHFIENNNYLVVKDYQYASAPFSKYSHWVKCLFQRFILKIFGINIYGYLMATHYIVLIRKQN